MTGQWERCDKSDLPVISCAHCLGHDDTAVADWAAGRPFTAHYDGPCARCQRQIHVGNMICELIDIGGYVHLHCAEDAT